MRRPQFTIRALMVLMFGAGCFFGGIHFERERRRREDESMAQGAYPEQMIILNDYPSEQVTVEPDD